MDRRNELKKLISDGNDNTTLYDSLVDDVIFLENQLIELRKLPFISVNPKNNMQQKSTPAAKQYKELLQQYTNCLKILAKATGQDLDNEESPLRAWANLRKGEINANTK